MGNNTAQGMIIDGIAASEAIDSSGEILDVKGCDISDLERGIAQCCWEHKTVDPDAKDYSPLDILGKIIFAKKIFGPEDCDDDRQKFYWNEVKLPYIYIKVRLYDGSGHPAAIAAAAAIRDHVKHNEPILIRYSIEGSTLEKKDNRLVRSVARRVAATIKPCNRSCHSGLISDPNEAKIDEAIQSALGKMFGADKKDDTKKSEILAPDAMKLGANEIQIDAGFLTKAIEAGNYNAAPSTLTGGSALQVEDRALHRNRIKEAVKKKIKEKLLRSAKEKSSSESSESSSSSAEQSEQSWGDEDERSMPQASDKFLHNYKELADDIKIKAKLKHDAAMIRSLNKTIQALLPLAKQENGPQTVEEHHLHPTSTDDHFNMVHQMSLEPLASHNMPHQKGVQDSWWAMGAQGKPVFVKKDDTHEFYVPGHKMSAVASEAAASALGRKLGLEKHVPLVAHVNVSDDPDSPNHHSITEGIQNAHHIGHFSPAQQNSILSDLQDSGTLHKLALFDFLINNPDRNRNNYLIDRTPSFGGHNIFLIDHGEALSPMHGKQQMAEANFNEMPHYLQGVQNRKDEIHPEASRWARMVTPEAVKGVIDQFYPNNPEISKAALSRLDEVKKAKRISDLYGSAMTKNEQSFDPKEIEMGIKVELEHTKDRKKAKQIALEHLRETPDYYSKLQECGLSKGGK